MKILLTGDIHFGARKNSSQFLDITKSLFIDLVPKIINDKHIDEIWILGDLFDDRYKLEAQVKNAVFEVFDYLLTKFHNLQIKVLLGNHDIYYNNTRKINFFRMFNKFNERFHIINDITTFNVDTLKVIMYPWLCENSEDYKLFINNSDHYDLCVGHFDINSFEVTPGTESQSDIKIDHFSKYTKVYTGHFHKKQQKHNIQYCGSPYEKDWGEYDNNPGFWIFDTFTQKDEFIPNTLSPKHIKIKISDIKHKINYPITNNWIKLFINEVIDDKERIKLINKVESLNPLELIIIDEVEGVELDNETDTEESFEGNELVFMNEYIDNSEINDKDITKNDLKLYNKSLYDFCLKENE